MTPADLERVRVALTEHPYDSELEGSLCCCGWKPGPGQSWFYGSYVAHIVAVLAAQEEETE